MTVEHLGWLWLALSAGLVLFVVLGWLVDMWDGLATWRRDRRDLARMRHQSWRWPDGGAV